ncbi:MAG: ABC transporter substrate-binding protein [Methylococcales symbiont of Iophon sp. n. MRB-2018]|nr:MAG: ABC transporter substrate-binding protein [Methylococcales symbiont of Iophon sp. n. MRB-2018]KAF3980025.1 MAG: ABC transporter substrate-binding protein [Methylococcales symbiont of Iophon sp. n. MRB-2018]
MNRHRLLYFYFCFLSLAGCSTGLTQHFLDNDKVFQAQALMQEGEYKEAVEIFQLLARSELAQQNQFNLLAAEAFIKFGDNHSAQTHIANINPSLLSVEQRGQFNLFSAQISLSNGEAEKALNQLNIIPPYSLNHKDKISFYQSLAFANSLIGRLLQSTEARIQLGPLLEISEQQDNNHTIFNALHLLSPQTLRLKQPPAPDVLGGWMALTRLIKTRKSNHDEIEFQSNLHKWKRVFPQHPAHSYFATILSDKTVSHNFNQISAIALLLPDSGRYAQAAQVIKEGFKAAYQLSIKQPVLRFYNSESSNIQNIYQQAVSEGADLIVGPLSKDNIQNLALNTVLKIPVLALNHVPNLIQHNLFQFGLSPIDGTEQISNTARNDGHDKILILASENRQGQRIANYLADNWEQTGGEVLDSQGYNPKGNDFSDPINELLNLGESKHRYQRIKRLLGTQIHFTERRRQDVNAIFLAAPAKVARSIYPQLLFYRATLLPIYSPSQIYSGRPSRSKDIDLNSITFCDIPWLFADAYQGDLSLVSLDSLSRQFPQKYIRLLALGIDSFNIIEHLDQLESVPYAGATGVLSVNSENRITRQLVCAKFIDGSPVLRSFVNKSPFDEYSIHLENDAE